MERSVDGSDAFDHFLMQQFLPRCPSEQMVYHYTTAAGLIGIIESGVIRGTNAAFLNDASEVAYGAGVCRSVLTQETAHRTDEAEQLVLRIAFEALDPGSEPTDVFVTSFSAKSDHLGQWRAYGSQVGGYCLGFKLMRFSERDFFRLPVPVEYDPVSQEKRVRQAVSFACELELDAVDKKHLATRRGVKLSAYLRRLMCLFKHPHFRDEHEWRSVAHVDQVNELQTIRFLDADGVPRPFVGMLDGSRETRRLPLVDVRVANKHRHALFATGLLLRRYGYDDVRVISTEIPFA